MGKYAISIRVKKRGDNWLYHSNREVLPLDSEVVTYLAESFREDENYIYFLCVNAFQQTVPNRVLKENIVNVEYREC